MEMRVTIEALDERGMVVVKEVYVGDDNDAGFQGDVEAALDSVADQVADWYSDGDEPTDWREQDDMAAASERLDNLRAEQ